MSNKIFSYYRVSSKSQEREGVSLEVQREANQKYATELGFVVDKEFVEVQSASKDGLRKEFYKMVEELREHDDIIGIIFHDVDRSSRSWADWAIIDKLVTDGFEIHFSKDKSGLNNRGQRLTADIKAAIAADFSRNLSQEVKKGMYKKLEDGFSMFGHAPTGYIPIGQGVKEVDPVMGPLVTECFNLYATGKYSMIDLADIMYKKGLRSKSGNKVTTSKICKMLNNRFYLGLFLVKGKIYDGKHTPLVSEAVFSKVKMIRENKLIVKKKKEEYKFPLLLTCGECGRRLRSTTAKHKYHYYACRNSDCPMKPVREELVEKWILAELEKMKFSEEQVNEMVEQTKQSKKSMVLALEQKRENLELQINLIKSRLSKLVDKDLDGDIPRDIYLRKRDDLNKDLKNLESELAMVDQYDDSSIDRKIELARLLADPVYAYQNANWEQRRKLIGSLIKDIKVSKYGLEFNYPSI